MTKKGKSQKPTIGKRLFWIIGLIILAVAAFLVYISFNFPSKTTIPESSDVNIKTESVDYSKLEGRWLRPYGGYVLNLSNIGANGQMTATYFNPRPINVSFAQWKNVDGRLSVSVELQDVNYPGSTYILNYDPASDRMQGIYYQAAMEKQFQVEFVRIK